MFYKGYTTKELPQYYIAFKACSMLLYFVFFQDDTSVRETLLRQRCHEPFEMSCITASVSVSFSFLLQQPYAPVQPNL